MLYREMLIFCGLCFQGVAPPKNPWRGKRRGQKRSNISLKALTFEDDVMSRQGLAQQPALFDFTRGADETLLSQKKKGQQ
jgi:hypothetical protein